MGLKLSLADPPVKSPIYQTVDVDDEEEDI